MHDNNNILLCKEIFNHRPLYDWIISYRPGLCKFLEIKIILNILKMCLRINTFFEHYYLLGEVQNELESTIFLFIIITLTLTHWTMHTELLLAMSYKAFFFIRNFKFWPFSLESRKKNMIDSFKKNKIWPTNRRRSNMVVAN